MKWTDLLLQSLQNLWRRKLRTILTILGVVLGTCSLVITVSLGIGQNNAIIEQAQEYGDLTIVRVSDNSRYEQQKGTSKRQTLKMNDELIARWSRLEHVIYVGPQLQLENVQTEFGNRKYGGNLWSLTGVDKRFFEVMEVPFIEGGPPTEDAGKTAWIAMGTEMRTNFYKKRSDGEMNYRITPPEDYDWLGEKFQMTLSNWESGSGTPAQAKTEARLSGLMGDINPYRYSEYNYGAMMDIDYLRKLVKENPKVFKDVDTSRYYEAVIKVDDFNNVTKVTDAIKKQLPEGHTLQLNTQMDSITYSKKQAQTTQLMLGGVGVVTMIMAAISIANTMMMSIYERTREIGVMKVLGCRLSNIMAQFLSEAGLIGLFGGILGVGASFGASKLLNFIFEYYSMGGGQGAMRSDLPAILLLGGFAFAVLVALISGLYPSQRAMRLSALAAIRNDG